MAALTLKDDVDFDSTATYQHVKNHLPSYARPRFLRIQVNTELLFSAVSASVLLLLSISNPLTVPGRMRCY